MYYLNTCAQCLQAVGDVCCRPVGRTLDGTVGLQDTEQKSLVFFNMMRFQKMPMIVLKKIDVTHRK